MKFKKISLGVLTPIVLAASLTLSVSCSVSDQDKTIKLFNHEFKNREEMIEYVLQNAERIKTKKGDISWIINNGDSKTFTSNLQLRKFVGKRISPVYMKSTMSKSDLENGSKNADLSIVDEQIKEILASTQTTDNDQRFYRGIKDSIFDNKADAILSYYQYHKIYRYNDINFRSKNELRFYLSKNYQNLSKFDQFRSGKSNLKAPNGASSDFIDFTKLEDRKYARNFIESTADKYIQIRRNDGTYKYVKVSDLITHKDSVSPADFSIGDVNAFSVKSNNGNATWITDSLTTNPANFYGDYFTKSKSNQILNINKPNSWKETKENPGQIISKSKKVQLLGKFFKVLNQLSALSEDNLTSDQIKEIAKINGIFDVPKYKKYINNIIQNNHSMNLKAMIATLKEDSAIMSKGKRYNPLYELPILYQKAITFSEEYRLNNKDINELRKFFEMIVDDYQDILDALFNIKVKTDKEGKTINLKHIFGINEYSFDLNSTPESVVYQLSESSSFMEGVELYFAAANNKIQAGGSMSFETAPLKLQHSANHEYFKKLWFVLTGDKDELTKTAAITGQFSKDLGRTLTNKNADVLFNIIKSQSILSKNMNNLYQASMMKNLTENISPFVNNGVIDIDKINLPDRLNGSEYEVKKTKVQKIIKRLEYVESKEYKGSIQVSTLKNNIKKLNTSTEREFKSKRVLSEYINVSKTTSTTNQLTKRQIRAKRLAKMSSKINSVQNGISIVADINNLAHMSFAKDTYEMLKNISHITGTLSAMTASQPEIAIVFSAASFILDLVAEGIGKEVQTIFKFQTSEENSNPFYWDGGLKKSHFWGLWEEKLQDKNDMKVMMPIKILKGVKHNYIYYNGKRYNEGDESMVKNQALIDFANGDKNAIRLGNKNQSIKMVYSYDKDPSISHFDTAKDLAQNILPIKANSKSIVKDNYAKYKFNSQFSVVGGTILFASTGQKDLEALKLVNINKTIEIIKPVIIAQFPELINGIPKEQIDNQIDKTPFIIPGKYFVNGTIKEWIKTHANYKNIKYVGLVNLNQLIKIDSTRFDDIKKDINKSFKPEDFKFTEKTAIALLEKAFLEKVDVQSIYTSVNEVMHKSHFSKLKSLKEIFVFKAKGVFGRDKYFTSYLDAFKWLVSKNQYKLTTWIAKGTSTQLVFHGHVFHSTIKLFEYVDKLIIKDGKKYAK